MKIRLKQNISILLTIMVVLLLISCSSQTELLLNKERVENKAIKDSLNLEIKKLVDEKQKVEFDLSVKREEFKTNNKNNSSKEQNYNFPYELGILTDKNSGNWSIEFFDLDNDTTIFEYNKDRNLLPASNLKVITTAAALKILGTDYKFTTKFFYNGYIDSLTKTLYGDIIVEGSGDPTIGRDYYTDTTMLKFKIITDSIKTKLSINKIAGEIKILNETNCEQWYGVGWDYDDLSKYYSPIISRVAFNENLIKIRVDKKGKLTTIPKYDFNFRLDTLKHLDRPIFKRVLGTDSVIIKANFEKNKRLRGFITVQNPEQLFISQLKKSFNENGISFIKSDNDSLLLENKLNFISNLYSDSLKLIIEKCNNESNNFYTEQIFRKMAEKYKFNGNGITKDDIFTYKDLLKTNKTIYSSLFSIEERNIEIADGSGLSRRNFVSSEMIVKALKTMFNEKELFSFYLSTLSTPGYKGSLQRKFTDELLIGKLFAKTGSMSGVNNLSGYLITNKGTRIAFSILNNYYNYYKGTMNRRIEEMLKFFVKYY